MTTTPTTRASLLLKLRDPRDHEAWVEFVILYEPVIIYRMLKKFGLQDADALEVMQELLLAVSRSVDRWTPGPEHGSFRGWLRRPLQKRIFIVEKTLHSIRQDDETNQMKKAVDLLLEDYKTDLELTAFTNLDYEQFYETR